VKQLLLTLLAVAVTATTGAVQAQNSAPTKGHRVGLIDMAHVFQNYKKFEELRSGLQAEIEKSDAEAKVMVERLQKMQVEIKKFDAGSPEYEQREKQLLDLKGEFDAFRAATQRRLARKESETFKVIYTDVTKAVKLYAEYAHFDHVMRFNRKGIEEITNPQEAVQTMNKTFIYTSSENDITDVVLQYLNKPYASGAPAKNQGTSALPAGRTRQQ
jgi:Skp family chaperone for outer membrane proteins